MDEYPNKPGMAPLFAACTDDRLSEFEDGLPAKLPEDYRRFLRERNGVFFAGELGFPMVQPWGEREHIELSSLYGLPCKPDHRDLREAGKAYEFEQRVPGNILAIGATMYRKFVCLSLSGKDRGTVYLWNPAEDWEAGPNVPTYHYLSPIASSFREFFDSIEETPQE